MNQTISSSQLMGEVLTYQQTTQRLRAELNSAHQECNMHWEALQVAKEDLARMKAMLQLANESTRREAAIVTAARAETAQLMGELDAARDEVSNLKRELAQSESARLVLVEDNDYHTKALSR